MNFTYLLGAGASANTMPVIAKFVERLALYEKEISDFEIKNDEFPKEFHLNEHPSSCKKQLVKDIHWLIKECTDHSSIDTFARKLFLTKNHKSLYRLKVLISDFLLYEQYFKGIDKRYDAFFATILDHDTDGNLRLPTNINILSWNYDKQIELSFAQFYDKTDNYSVEERLNIYPRKDTDTINRIGFSVIKLNGTIGGRVNEEKYVPIEMNFSMIKDTINSETKNKIIINILYRHGELTHNLKKWNETKLKKIVPTIQYSWENSNLISILLQNAYKAIASTKCLVIIGYSFPNFNRIVDKSILKNMKGLQKIYVQSRPETIDGVLQRLNSLLENDKIKPIPITNTDEFYIPFEY